MDRPAFNASAQEHLQALLAVHYPNDEPIAVVGYACRFPQAEDSEAFWRNLLQGRECSQRLSQQELQAAGIDRATIDAPNFVNVASIVHDADTFDAGLFGYARTEAEAMDPQQRLFLHIAWHALEHAGFAPRAVPHKTSVFGAARVSTYPGQEAVRLSDVAQAKGLQSLMGNDKDYVATRVAYKLNLRGPALSVQTACSSSLVAVHLACESLRSGESDMALAGGVAVSFPQHSGYLYQPGMIFSPDGSCRPFDAQAQGTFAGNGVAAVVLRRLADALADGDRVLAVLPASAMNNDGNQKVGYTAPSVAGQQEVITQALAAAGLDSRRIGMIEAHGTATALGDPIEVQALRAVFHAVDDGPPCALGSLKGNLGHLDTAAGIASLLKAVLAVEHGVIPPSLHFERANPALQLADSPFYVPTEAQLWSSEERIAGVSSFGIGGTNCHVLVSALPAALRELTPASGAVPTPGAALLLSAASERALRQLAAAYAVAWTRSAPQDLAHTALHGRQLDLPHRLALPLCEDSPAALTAFAAGSADAQLHYGHAEAGKLVWVFSGGEAQWPGMGRTLYRQSQPFAACLERCLRACGDEFGAVLRSAMFGREAATLAQREYAQPAAAAFQLAMAAHWQALGLTPDLVLGHGVGEYAAAVVAGHYEIEHIMPLVCERGRLLQDAMPAQRAAFVQQATALHAAAGKLPLISTRFGCSIDASRLNNASYWWRQLREPKRVLRACRQARTLGGTIFLELGAEAILTDIVQAQATSVGNWIVSARRSVAASTQLDTALLQLYAAGLDLDWPQLLPSSGRKVAAPLYVFDAQRYWREAGATVPTATLDCIEAAVGEGQRVARQQAQKLDLPRLQAFYHCVGQLHAIYVDQLLQRCVGADFAHGVSVLQIVRGGRLLPRYQQLLMRLLNACVADAYYQCNADGNYAPLRPAPHAQRQLLLQELRSYCEGLDVIADTVAHAGEQLHAMLSGAVEPLAVIFPAASSRGVEVLYQEFSFGRYFNQIAAGVLSGWLRAHSCRMQRQPLRILEVGGGTGGTTASLLPELAAYAQQQAVHYEFTDISALFTGRASEKFAAYDFLQYRQFDLQKSAAEQGFAAASYDLIVAANVIHATQHIGHALDNLRPLLKPGGSLVMREITQPMRLFDFVFGALVLPLQDEAARDAGVFLSCAAWQQHCLAAGFARVDCLPQEGSATAAISEHIVLASTAVEPVAALPPSPLPAQDPLLGQALAEHGSYLVDWSDCADQPQHWRSRVQQAAAELSRRHGAGLAVDITALPTTPPSLAALTSLRLRWLAEPFDKAGMVIENRSDRGHWYALTAMPTDVPVALSAPDTHYAWCWQQAPHSDTTVEISYSLPAGPAALAAVLAANGVQLSAQGQCRLLVLAAGITPQALAASLLAALAAPMPLIVITRAAWRVLPDEAVQAVPHAAWGLLRAAAVERAQCGAPSVAALDLAAHANWTDVLPGLAALRAGARWVAVRDGVVWTPHLRVQDYAAPALPWQAFHAPGWHLVTGGLGALGRQSIAWLAHHGARRIALAVPRVHADWPALERSLTAQYGCTLQCMLCDVAEPTQLNELLMRLQADGGISGAIHAAGMLDDTPLQQLDAARMAALWAPKAEAARLLLDWLHAHQSQYLLLYSSAAAALGAPGQAAHAFASGYLDGLAQEHAGSAALLVTAVAWGAWADAGRSAAPEMQQTLAAGGMGLLSNGEGFWHLEQAVMRGAPYRLAMRLLPAQLDAPRRALLDSAVIAPAPSASEATLVTQAALPALDDAAAVSAWLTARIAHQLRLTSVGVLRPEQDLLQLGLDSLLFLELSADIERQLGIRLDSARAYDDLSITALTALIMAGAPAASAHSLLKHDAAQRFAAFPLTPIQHAYWLGRTGLIDYGGVACHILFEWDLRQDDFDPVRLEAAWNRLIAHHDMLRMVVDADGSQRILAQVPHYQLPRHDLRQLSASAQQAALLANRAALSTRVLPTDRWPLFELQISQCDAQRYRLHMHLDLLLFDVQSFKIMMDDLTCLYQGQTLTPLAITYRDYVLAEQARRKQPDWQQSWRYWLERLALLPAAPQLPLAAVAPGAPGTAPRVVSYQMRLERQDWSALKLRWQSWGVTPSAALLAMFAQTLERWSRQPDFTLALTFFNRRDIHPQVAQLIGDFTSVLLMDFDLRQPQTLRATMEQTQQRLWQHLAHSQVNGVELMRELGRLHADGRQPRMPVVFTSMLGMRLDGLSVDQAITSLLGDPVHVFTQTPQVWLDHQVMEIDGALVANWHCMEGVLEGACARAMFDDFQALLHAVAVQPQYLSTTVLTGLRADGSWQDLQHRAWPLLHTALDLREIEQTLRAQTMVAQAQANWCEQEHCLAITVVASAPATVDEDGVAASYHSEALPTLTATQLAEVEATWHWLDLRAQQGMLASLQRHDLFVAPGQAHRLDEVHAALGALPQHLRLLRQWLRLLTARGVLRCEDEHFVLAQTSTPTRTPTPMPAPSLDSLPEAAWSQALAAYLERCLGAHASLFNGSQSALTLLFGFGPDDPDAVAPVFYRDNPVIDCLHRSAAQIVAALGAQDRHALQVLEVGAGTGASTQQLLPALAGRLARYRFTDVSELFLNDARKRFADHALLDYALFDLNAALDFEQHPASGYDLIVAVNVLHDARDVLQSLRRLRQLLCAGGHLLLIEATERDSALQLASIGFIESLNGYQDGRRSDDQVMLEAAAWRTLLAQAGFAVALTWPAQDDTPWRQHLILASAQQCLRLDTAQIAAQLQTRYGAALPPLRVCQRECLPAPVALAAAETASTMAAVPVAALPVAQHALEQQVAVLWQELLSRPITGNSDFFRNGGDSLIATRMVARLNRAGIASAALGALFEQPTLAGFCATLTPPEPPQSAVQCATLLLAQGDVAQQAFVFHASDGELAAYLPLAVRLGWQVHGVQASALDDVASLDELAARYVRALRQTQANGPYLLIGWSYGSFLAAAAAQLLTGMGEPVQLVLLDPVCRADFCYTDQASLQRLLEQGRLPPTMQLHDGSPQQVPWLARTARLLDLLAQHHAAPYLPIPCLWLSAAQRPSHWRAAEQEWQAWEASSQRRSIDADHWTLIMDELVAEQTAAVIRQWHQQYCQPQERTA